LVDVKIKKKQRNLLLKSEVINDYPWLHSLLARHEKVDVEQVPDNLKEEFVNITPFILKQGGEEWKGNEDVLSPVDDLGSDRKRCALCGTKNRYIFYIKNRLNGNTLNVGRDCVEEFADFDFLQNGKSISELMKNARKVKRMSEVNKRFNGIDQIVESWFRMSDKYQVIIPNYIEKPYFDCGNLIKQYYEGYLEEKHSESIFNKIGQLLKSYSMFIEQMDDYQIENINDKYVVTKPMLSWMKSKKLNDIIEMVKEDGKISPSTIQKVYETSFMKKINNDVVKILEKLKLEVLKTDYENQVYIIQPDMHNGQVLLSLRFDKLVYFFGGLLFQEKSYASLDMKNLIRISEINDEGSIDSLVEVLSYKPFKRIRMKLHYESFQLNEIDITNIANGEVSIINLKSFVEESKRFLLYATETELDKFEEYILSIETKKYTRQELDELREQVGSISNRFSSLGD
jgi:hypothetical protein